MDELRLSLDYELGGEVRTAYRGQQVALRDTRLAIEALDGVPESIRLQARFDSPALAQVAELLAGLAVPAGGADLELAMTPAALQANGPAFAQAGSAEEWLQAGNGACLNLENYAVHRLVSAAGHQPLELEFELD